jgi:hypothetical protein
MAEKLNLCFVSDRWYAISISVCAKAGRNSYFGPETGYCNKEISRNSLVHLKENADIKLSKKYARISASLLHIGLQLTYPAWSLQ